MSDNPDITKYFKNHTSPAASFFDQISTAGGGSENGSAMMTSVRESASSQDLFLAASQALLNDQHSNKYSGLPATLENVIESSDTQRTFNESADNHLYSSTPTPTSREDEPVVCRIFSQENVSDDSNNSSAKTFFDMLVSKSSSMDLLIPSIPLNSSASSLVTSPEFTTTEGSYMTPNTPTPTGGINDETFSKASSEADRHRDAWLPCPATRRALLCCATSAPGACTLDRQLLTMPGVALTHELPDAVAELVTRHLGEPEASKRKVLSANDVTQDEKGLRELIQAGCYRAAVNLTGRLLTIYGQGTGKAGQQSKHTAHSVQLWFTRIALHVKLRAFALAEEEAAPFGDLDRPDLYFQYYQELYGGRMGSLAPFAFRLLLAELPQYQGDHPETLTRLHKILATVRKILKNLTDGLSEDGSPAPLTPNDRAESIKLWTSRETRVLHSIVNCALYQKDFTLAIEILEMLLSTREWSGHQQRALQSALGRVYLQLGDVIGAERNFNKSKELKQISNFSGDLANENDLRDLIDRGLVAVAQNAFLEGYEAFQRASVLDPSNIMLLNNMAVCLLYVGRLNEALNLLEGAINNNPNAGLHESVLLNLCILYELESSRCLQKKLSMLKLLSRYKGDGIEISCLKLN